MAAFVATALSGCGKGPNPAADWRMTDRTRDEFTDNPPFDPQRGPDGVVDVYDHAQGPLVPRRNGNISTKFPADGLYDVVLDACGTQGAARYSWSIDGGPNRAADDCATTVRLPEGEHTAVLTAADSDGNESGLRLSLNVQDLIVVGLGDSFSAGSGNSRGGLVSADYDNIDCTRSGRSGQAAAALALEKRDPKTSVTFIQLACGGARATLGFLAAHNDQAPQILELSGILPPGQRVDFVSFTIGGNDVRFSEIVGQLVSEPDAPLSAIDGEQTHARVQRQLVELRDTMARVAACFGTGFEGRPCEVQGPSGRDDDTTVVRVPPIPLVSPDRIVQIAYPDLTSLSVRDAAGSASIATCPSGAVERPGDLLDGLLDNLVNGRSDEPRTPFISGSEWAWGDATLLQPADPAPNDASPAMYNYALEASGASVPLPLLNTLNSIAMESHARFGWTSSDRWWRDSRGHGYCTPLGQNWFYRAIFHPNDLGYAGEAAGLVAEADRLGVAVVR